MFLTDLSADFTPSGRWHLRRPLEYRTHEGVLIKVPTDYSTDLFSIPRPLRAVFDTDGPGAPSSVIHDFIYTDLTDVYTKAEADRIFRQALADCGVGWAARWTMWAGVRANITGGNW